MKEVEQVTPLMLPADNPAALLRAAQLLRDGGVIAVPTDTVYGLAASIFQSESVTRIFAIKRRSPEAAVPVLLATAADLSILVREVPHAAWRLIDRFWPGPLTLVLPARDSVSKAITGGTRTVAVRVPAGRSILELLETLGEPVIGTSANLHGQPPATTAAEVREQLGREIDAILIDDLAPRGGGPSTVAEITADACIVHRVGAIGIDSIRSVVGLAITVRR